MSKWHLEFWGLLFNLILILFLYKNRTLTSFLIILILFSCQWLISFLWFCNKMKFSWLNFWWIVFSSILLFHFKHFFRRLYLKNLSFFSYIWWDNWMCINISILFLENILLICANALLYITSKNTWLQNLINIWS